MDGKERGLAAVNETLLHDDHDDHEDHDVRKVQAAPPATACFVFANDGPQGRHSAELQQQLPEGWPTTRRVVKPFSVVIVVMSLIVLML